jgi:hypothetical protein
MPTFRYGRTSAVAYDKLDASQFIDNAGYSIKLSNAETTHFQSPAKEYIPGILDGSLNLSGMYDATNSVTQPTIVSADATLDAMENAGTVDPFPVTLAFDGGFEPGRAILLAVAYQTGYSPGTALGGVANMKVEALCNGRPRRGFALSSYAPITTATTLNGASVDAGAATSAGGTWALHATSNTRTGTTTVKVQHSTDQSVWVDLLTQVVPVGTQIAYAIPAAGTVNRYLRSVITTAAGSGAVTVLSAFARN